MTAAGIAWVKYTTVVLFASFILMTLILYLPQRHKPYQDAEKLALKDKIYDYLRKVEAERG